MEIIAAVLFFSNFALSVIAASLAVMLFRHHRQNGWLLLAVAFLCPFFTLLLRLVNGFALLNYRSVGSNAAGQAQEILHYNFPGFYLVVVAALLLLLRDARRSK